MEKDKRLKRHENRDDLVGEYIWGDMGQIILLMIFLIIWVGDSFVFHHSTFLSKYVSFYILLPISLVILFCSGYLARSGLRIVFGEVREQPAVIRKGVFGIVRHPIYLGSILFYLGLIISTISLLSLAVWLIIIVFYYFISRYEEKLLLQKFGNDYQTYLDEVPMWIPRLISAEKIS